MAKVIHLCDPSQDFSLCGDSDDGVLLDEVPIIAKGNEFVTCPRCLQIIDHCVKYAAEHSAHPTHKSGRKLPSKKSNRKGSAPAVSG
jgi:hypothetical protein